MAGRFLAFDLGAESGRAIVGTVEGFSVSLMEVTRFANRMVSLDGHLHWDVPGLMGKIKNVISECAGGSVQLPGPLTSIGIDTWGVDYALLDANGEMLGLPYSYRDSRTEGAMTGFFKRVSREHVYGLTGIQLMPFNTLFQLYAMTQHNFEQIESASDLLFMPDLFNYFLTGTKLSEFTFATTSQLFNPWKRRWEEELLDALGVSQDIMQEVVEPGSVLANASATVRRETGLAEEVPFVAVGSHDTASAVAAVPAEGSGWAYISSGTWSLMGVETTQPVINADTLSLNFTNEGGVEGTFRLLKNITGLWLLNRCRAEWASGGVAPAYEELSGWAAGARPFCAFIDPDYGGFSNPASMPVEIAKYCLVTGQDIPEEPAQVARLILEGLALKYRDVLGQIRKVYPGLIDRLHVVGGGARNELLCQFTANATGLPVIAGPFEATAIGNVMVQARAMGVVESLAEGRAIIRNSFELEIYLPEDTAEWDSAYESFVETCMKSSTIFEL